MALKYVASYLLAVTCGNESPSKDDVRDVLNSVGSEVDEDALSAFFSAVSGKVVHETISAGLDKLQTLPAGGGVSVASTVQASGSSEKQEEAKKEAEPEEEEDDMGFSLFD
ncbi:60S acidic ribosomal protein p2, putative [Theileria annulata]|uniref:60S acidic ribosomal protein p2, putative n=1 Tax=Theileria annulata TaxID=5874 RepID=Q4UE75_THEAN|nr:60S acidic ribosomal protein p2, putative [Theileria annulata]CAI74614.1 60S acidic ribosomal protein p2, putative [Theileria annulata]|eukprot:XP_952346.1 60S acidic ribosomal protein p2, putative [Theileria annulata]